MQIASTREYFGEEICWNIRNPHLEKQLELLDDNVGWERISNIALADNLSPVVRRLVFEELEEMAEAEKEHLLKLGLKFTRLEKRGRS